jgi:hypothetical protein
VLQRRRHGLGVLVLRRRRAAGRGGRAVLGVRRPALLLLLQLPQLHENTTRMEASMCSRHRRAWTMYTTNVLNLRL